MFETNSGKPSGVEVFLRLAYSTHSRIAIEYTEPSDFILKAKAEIVADADDDDPPATAKIGTLEFYLIRLGEALNQGVGYFDIFDSYQETMDLAEAVFDGSFSEFKPVVARRFPDASTSDDILLLHRLQIHPLTRGQRIGLAVLDRAMLDWSSGCSLVVIKPFPLQFEAGALERRSWTELKLGDFPSAEKEAFKRLSAYYEQLGFERLGRTEFFALSTAVVRPSVRGLGITDSFTIPSELFAVHPGTERSAKETPE
jgi:GNAT superfamily N-acetyltransferase